MARRHHNNKDKGIGIAILVVWTMVLISVPTYRIYQLKRALATFQWSFVRSTNKPIDLDDIVNMSYNSTRVCLMLRDNIAMATYTPHDTDKIDNLFDRAKAYSIPITVITE